MSNPSAPAGNGVMGQATRAGLFDDPSFIDPAYGGTFGQPRTQPAQESAPAPLPQRAPEPIAAPMATPAPRDTESAFTAIVDSALGGGSVESRDPDVQPTQGAVPAQATAPKQQAGGSFFNPPRGMGGDSDQGTTTASNRESIF